METQRKEFRPDSGTAGTEPRDWFVVYSKPHKEETARFHLESKGIRVFFPRLLLPETPRRRQRLVPLFPNYLFVHIRLRDEASYVTWAPGVNRIISFNGVPASLDERAVSFLMERANDEGLIRVWPGLRVGKRVQICGGPLEGLVGILDAPPDARGRVRVLTQLLSRQVRMDVPVEWIRSGPC